MLHSLLHEAKKCAQLFRVRAAKENRERERAQGKAYSDMLSTHVSVAGYGCGSPYLHKERHTSMHCTMWTLQKL